MRPSTSWLRTSAALALVPVVALLVGTPSAGAAQAPPTATYTIAPIVDTSTQCGTQNAEVETATDPKLSYVYQAWMGCGISFSRSTSGGTSYGAPLSLPGSTGSQTNSWDPAIAVGPQGQVYVAFMVSHNNQWYPVVDASFDNGRTFTQSTSLIPPDSKNWGDREFLAVAPDGTIYLTWDYGPNRSSVTSICPANGSCAFATGDLNVVLQKSTDGGRSFGPMSYISPGFPASGGDSAPLVVEPNGRVDVLYQAYTVTDPVSYALDPAYEYFTSTTDQGATWSRPVRVGASVGTMAPEEWWIDGDIAVDGGGNLYATWDTQRTAADGTATDIGWLSYSTDHGVTWSAPIQAPADTLGVPHVMQAVGGPAGIVYVAWLSSSDPAGYGLYLRTYKLGTGWISPQTRVSTSFGDTSVWPGDTIGIATLSPTRLALAWGSAIPSGNKKSDVFATTVTIKLP